MANDQHERFGHDLCNDQAEAHMKTLNIGQAAKASGISAKMIRHYESSGVIPVALRSEAGYRLYGEAEIHALRFVRHARDLGFSLPMIGELVGLWRNRSRPSRQVKALAHAHIQGLEQKAQELLAMKTALEALVNCCHGDERPECPILEKLASNAPALPMRIVNGSAVQRHRKLNR